MPQMSEIDTILNLVGEPALYEQLAEECCELAHASLKMARKLRAENPTPVEKEEITENIIEEYNDVVLCVDIINRNTNVSLIKDRHDLRYYKIHRWLDRLSSQQ